MSIDSRVEANERILRELEITREDGSVTRSFLWKKSYARPYKGKLALNYSH